MDPLLLLQIAILLFISAVMSGSETGLYGVSRVRMRYRLAQDDRRAGVLDRLLHPVGPTIITILIGNNIANQALATVMERGLAPLGDPWTVIVTIGLLTPLVLIFGEFLPKYLFHRHADRWMYAMVDLLRLLRGVLAVPVRLVQGATTLVERIAGFSHHEIWEPHASRPNLRTFLSAEGGGPNLSATQAELVDRVLVMERIALAYEGVSKPLGVIASFDAAATAATVRKNLDQTVYQRYLVDDHSSGQPIGYISATDLVIADDAATMGSLARAMPVLRDTTPLHHALQRMHAEGADMCLVTDEQGQVVRVAFRGDCVRVLANLD